MHMDILLGPFSIPVLCHLVTVAHCSVYVLPVGSKTILGWLYTNVQICFITIEGAFFIVTAVIKECIHLFGTVDLLHKSVPIITYSIPLFALGNHSSS